jgi:hypothetical protein
MTWAGERRLQYIGGIALFVVLVSGGVYWKYFKKTPTCSDNIQNGTETGVDCGGICVRYCKNEITNPKVRWQLPFVVTPTSTTAVAYIEHGFAGVSARTVNYKFDVYDADGSVIATRAGSTFVGTVGKSAIVEPLIQVDGSKVAQVRFSFLGDIVWEKTDPTISTFVIKTDITRAENFEAGTRVRALLENKTDTTFTNIPVSVILYDTNENAIAASVATLDILGAKQNKEIVFTWPDTTLLKKINRIEVLPRINPFTLSQK